ncbi:uncharacterized protein [Taeniopygia guttata]|uniref:uncharacterized protein isoform X1 n=1 Tax=Taeniopygia guttata TaxID=59729 RepID=UPI0013F1F8A9
MGRGAAAGAVLVALVALGAAPAAGAELSGVLQEMVYHECHFTNGTERVRYVERLIYNREQYLMFDTDVGEFVGFTPRGEKCATHWNSNPKWMEYKRTAVDWFCKFCAPQRLHLAGALELPARPRPPALLRAGFLPCPDPGEVVPGPAGALGARGGHRGGPQRGLELPAAGAAGNPPPARAHLQLPGGARQPGAPPEPELGDAAGRRPQQDADGHRGLRLGLALPGAGARLLPAQEELLSRRRPQPLPAASGPAGTPRSVPAGILGGSRVPPSPAAALPPPARSQCSQ